MSENERLLATDAVVTASVKEKRWEMNKRFTILTASLLGVCGVMLSCHTQLEAIKLNVHDEVGTEDADVAKEAVELSVDAKSSGKGIGGSASHSHASLISLQDIPTSAMGLTAKQFPSWWNDTEYLPDAQPIFVHIPKTGGVSVEDLASKAGHVTGACVVHSFGDVAMPYPLAKGYLMEPYHTPPARFVPYSFTVVRNPYARMVSEFNWVSLYDPVKAAEIKAGKWTFSCDDFQEFVKDRVNGLTGSPRFQCLQKEGFAQEGYETCDAKGLGTIDDSHALPQWLFAKNAERVFKYEDYENEVWPFLRGTGVVRRKQIVEKINSAGAVSETAAKCWPFMSKDVLSDFIALYAMDFKNLGYRTTAFGEDTAAGALGDARGVAKNSRGGGGGVTVTTKDGGEVPSLAMMDPDPSKPMSEEFKAEARAARFNIDVSEVDLEKLRAPLADDVKDVAAGAGEETGGLAASSLLMPDVAAQGKTEEKDGRTTPGCVRPDAVQALGAGEEEGTDWTPPSWAVVEGVLRRGVFKSQSLTEKLKTSVKNAGDSLAGVGASGTAVAAALKSVTEARDLGETAARNPLGKGGHKAFAKAAKAAKAASKAVKSASSTLNAESSPQAVRDQFADYAAKAAEMSGAFAEAVHIRRAREEELFDQLYASQKSDHAAALSGYLRR